MQKKDWIIVILLLIIFFLLGFGVSYYVFNVKVSDNTKTEEKVEEKKEEPKQEEPTPLEPEEFTYHFDYNGTSLSDAIQSAGFKPNALSSIYDVDNNTTDEIVGSSFTYNGTTIFVGCDGKLTKTKPTSCDSSYTAISVSYFNGYYIERNFVPAGSSGTLTIYDKDVNLVLESSFDDVGIYLVNSDVFYGVPLCEGKKPDGTTGEVVEVHRFNTDTGKDLVEFNLDHVAGWAC